MSNIQMVSVIMGTWSIIYLINTFLLTYSRTSLAYAKFLHKSGLSINIMQIKWYTVKINRLFFKLANWNPSFWKTWFNVGVFVGVVGQVFSVGLLIYTLVDFFKAKPSNEQVLVPVIPGVNLPNNQIFYYFITLLICGLVHEFGHGIAASREQVRVNGFGIFLMFIFPGAFVDLYTDHVEFVSPIKQLRIFCAGVWHNVVFALVAIFLLETHPLFVQSFFNQNAYIGSIATSSPIRPLLSDGAIIQRIETCSVKNSYEWYVCLNSIEKNQINGYCMTEIDIKRYSILNLKTDKVMNDCCSNNTASSFCFKWTNSLTSSKNQMYSCLPARRTTEHDLCNSNENCKNSFCVFPLLDNVTRLVKIYHDKGAPVLYVGTINELRYTVLLKDYMAKYAFVPEFLNAELKLLLKYLIAFNGAIGLLNLVPCYALDGQYILGALLLSKNTKTFRNMNLNNYPRTYSIVLKFGTILLVLNMVLSILTLFL